MFLAKNKRFLWIALAVVFVGTLFLLKNKTLFQNQPLNQVNGSAISYDGKLVSDLVTIDTDSDGIADWEETLWGTDPTQKVSNSEEIEDSLYIAKLKNEKVVGGIEGETKKEEDLSQTDKFSRELFSTVAALNQAGPVDQDTVDKLSESIAEKMKNPVVRKVFLESDIKIINDNSVKAYTNYQKALTSIQTKYPTTHTVMDVLQKFIVDENTVDESALTDLDPILVQINKILDAILKTSVPESISNLHLEVINALERLSENVSDIRLYEKDPIVSMVAMGKYEENTDSLQSTFTALIDAINKKLGI